MGGCGSGMRMPNEKRFRRAIKLYEVSEVQSLTNLFNRNKCFATGDSPLTLATQQGHEVIVTSLIEAGADVNKLDCNGRAAVHVACQFNDLQTLKILLENKADPNRVSSDGLQPLHIAAERGFADVVNALLQHGAEPNISQLSSTPLHCAVVKGHVDCVAALLRAGADPDAIDGRGLSSLGHAVLNGHVSCSEILLKHRGLAGRPTVSNGDLLGMAIDSDCVELVSMLLASGCGVEEMGSCPQQQGSCRPLIRATIRGKADMVDLLLRSSANLNAADDQNNTALHLAVMAVVDPRWKLNYLSRFTSPLLRGRLARQRSVPSENGYIGDGYVRCAMSLVQAGANVASVWPSFSSCFPDRNALSNGITFQQMVVCEVLTQAYGFRDTAANQLSDFVCCLLSIGEFGLVKLVYSAGVHPSRDAEMLLATRCGQPLYDVMFEYVKRLRRNPRSLRDRCRQVVRRTLSWNTLYLVNKLTLSDDIKDYLCIMDTDHYSDVP